MEQPRKSWARIDSTLQRNLGHKKYYEIPIENLPGTLVENDILRFPDSDANPNVPEHMILRYHEPDSRPQAPETLILQHHDLVSRPQAPELLIQQYPELRNNPNSIGYPGYQFTPEEISRFLSDIKQYPPKEVQSGPQPITTFGEGFRQSLDQWKNNYSYDYGNLMKEMNHEEEIRNGLMALDENPELSRGNVQEINWSIKALRRGIAEYRRRIEAGEGTPEDEAAILKDSEKIRGLYAMQQQYYKGATPEEAEAWRNNYIAQGGTGMQRMAEARENQKNYRPTEGWANVGEIAFNLAQVVPAVAATAVNPAVGAIAIGAGMGDIASQNLAQSNMLADQIEEQTGKEISTGRRLAQAGIGTTIDAATSLFAPTKMVNASQPFFKSLAKNSIYQGIFNGTNSILHDYGSNLTLGNNLTNNEILSNAGKNFLVGAATGAGATTVGKLANKVSRTSSPVREIPDEAGTKSTSSGDKIIPYSIPDLGYYRLKMKPLSPSVRDALIKEGVIIDDTPTTIPFDTYRRKQLAPPGTYVRPYQNPGKIDPNDLRMIPRDEVQDNMTIPMNRYQLSYPLPEGMSNEPITIPHGRYGHGSSFWGDNFRLSYPLPEGMSNEPITIPHGRYGSGSSFWGDNFRLSYPLPDDWDNSPVTIPFDTYRRKQLAPPGTYVRPYQNPGKIDPNGLRMIPREEVQDNMTIPMNRYQLSYPLPEGMSNEPITIPHGRYGSGSSFWGDNFRLSYPLPEDWDNSPVTIPFDTYRRKQLAPPGTYVRPYQNPGKIDPNGLRMIPREEAQDYMSIPMNRYQFSYPLPDDWDNSPITIPFDTYRRKQLAPPGTYVRPYQNPGKIDPNGLRMIPRDELQENMTAPGSMGREPQAGATSSEANDTATPFKAYEDMFGIDKLDDNDKKAKTPRGRKKRKK